MLVMSAAAAGCGPVHDLRDFSGTDLFPPVIMGILPLDSKTVKLSFNEEIVIDLPPGICPDAGELCCEVDGSDLVITTEGSQAAGTRYFVEAAVRDKRGNRMSFMMPFYGFNPELPGIIINEFTTQGSSKHPDVVELLVTEGGNTAGLWITEGTTDFSEQAIGLPSCRVEGGEFILIHFKPQGIPDEVNEDGDDLALSGGYDASDSARDFWVEGGSGLSGNNGVLSLYSAPGGTLLDAVLYSNRTSASDEKYRGFGSTKMLEKARQLHSEGGWIVTGSDGREPRPEDGVNPDDSTATRSICRMPGAADTDTAADWHIVPTSSSSFGEINCEEIYVKK